MSITKDQIIGAIAAMSVTDIVELITAMEEKFGVSTAISTTTVLSNVSTDVNATDSAVEEQIEFDVVLKSIGANKITVIKAVRSATGLGLKEAKDLVESAPTVLKEGVNRDEAETLRKSLEEAGAKVEIK